MYGGIGKAARNWACFDAIVDALRELGDEGASRSLADGCQQDHGRDADGTMNYVKGANLAGFIKVADAMLDQGVV